MIMTMVMICQLAASTKHRLCKSQLWLPLVTAAMSAPRRLALAALRLLRRRLFRLQPRRCMSVEAPTLAPLRRIQPLGGFLGMALSSLQCKLLRLKQPMLEGRDKGSCFAGP